MRSEYRALCAERQKKEREWSAKMSGFYNSTKLQRLEKADSEQMQLRQKLQRQVFSERND